MKTYVRARRLLRTSVVTLFVLVVGGLLGSFSLRVPGLIGGGESVLPFSTLLPLVAAIGYADGLISRERPQELASYRSRGFYDAGYGFAVLAVLAVGTRLWADSPSHLDLWFLRNSGLFIGVVMLGAATGSAARGAAATALLLVLTTAYGPASRGAHLVRVLQNPAGDVWSAAASAVVLCCGSLALLLTDQPIVDRALRWSKRR